jgi:hypothetical protein
VHLFFANSLTSGDRRRMPWRAQEVSTHETAGALKDARMTFPHYAVGVARQAAS